MSAETLSTPRLRLRRPLAADDARQTHLITDPDVARMTTRIPHPYRLQDAHDFLAHASDSLFAIDLSEAGLIGLIGFRDATVLGPEIGHWIGKPYWGRGLATGAATAAFVWAHRDWSKRCLVSGHFADTPASGAVLNKAWFLYTGEVTKHSSLARGGQVVHTRRMIRLA